MVSADPVIQPTTAASIMMARSHVSFCPVARWSLTPPELWVATLAFPSVLWPCFAVAHRPHVDVSAYCCVFLSPDLGRPLVPVPVSCWLSYTQPLLLSLTEPQGRGPDLIQCWAASRFSQPPTRPSAQMVCADIRGNKASAASHWPGQRSVQKTLTQSLLCDLVGISDGNGTEPRNSRCCSHLCLTSSSSSPSHTRLARHRRRKAGGGALLDLSGWKASMKEFAGHHRDIYYLKKRKSAMEMLIHNILTCSWGTLV